MTVDRYEPRRGVLCVLVPVALTYLAWQRYVPWYSGHDWLDGSVGILLGLYTCSRPAANSIDLFFAERGALRRVFTRRAGIEWVLLNSVVMLVGWLVIVAAASRLPGSTAPTVPGP